MTKTKVNKFRFYCKCHFLPNFSDSELQNGQCVDSTPRDVRLMMHRVHVLHQQLQGFVQRYTALASEFETFYSAQGS